MRTNSHFIIASTLWLFTSLNSFAYSLEKTHDSEDFSINLHRLQNKNTYVDITPSIGGRLLSFGIRGKPSVIVSGEPVKQNIKPVASPFADNIGYLGHIVWLAPQSHWWAKQTLNTERKNKKAQWPPDPYIIFTENKVKYASNHKLLLTGLNSPISNIRLDKQFELSKTSSILEVSASVTNIGKEAEDWSIWFNTRVYPDTQIYIPITSQQDVKQQPLDSGSIAPLVTIIKDNILSLELVTPPEGKDWRQGKLFIHPSEPWIAGFRGNQLFIKRFKMTERSSIHKEHALVEIYAKINPSIPDEGLIEMESHTARKTLPVGTKTEATELWSLHLYSGRHSRKEHIEFIRKTLIGIKRKS